MKTPLLILVAAVIILPLAAFFLTQSSSSTSTTTNPTTMPTATSTPSAVPNPTDPADVTSAHQVKLSTSMGDILLNLYPDDAPLAVKNFVTLGKRGYYDGTIFHRVIADFMIQGGDPTGTGTGGSSIYGTYFKTELNSRQFDAGTLGAARTSAMNTNGSQFFITSVAYPSLNNQYTVFGHTADAASLAVVTAIDNVKTDSNSKPLTPVTVTGFTITQP